MGVVWFVGAGPGDPDLLTVKGLKLLQQAGLVLYAGSLVDRAAALNAPPGCDIRDSAGMTLEEINACLIDAAAQHAVVVRLQTGDPGLYGALIEMGQALDAAGVEWHVVPGVTSAMASAAAAKETLTLPEVTQTVIFSRVAGRTPMPEGEDLESLAAHHSTLCLYLSITLLHEVQRALRSAGWAEDAPILVVQKASWPGEQKIIRGTLADIKKKCQAERVGSQAMIIVSPTLGALERPLTARSKLYDPSFSHRFRRAVSDSIRPEPVEGLSPSASYPVETP